MASSTFSIAAVFSSQITARWVHLFTLYSPAAIEFVGGAIVQLAFFWVPCVVYTVLLPTLLPAFSARHRIQPSERTPPLSSLLPAHLVALRNQGISLGLSLAVALLHSSQQHRAGPIRVVAKPPSPSEFALGFALCMAGRDVLFYHLHRALHLSPRVYKAVHKAHHRFTAPVAVAALYAHPVEHVVANVLPVALPPALLGVHVWTAWFFVAAVLVETTTVHSGYDFLGGVARMHDAHHEKFNGNYGVLGLVDWLYGTTITGGPEKAKGETKAEVGKE